MQSSNLIELFKEKIFYAEQTVIVSLFGVYLLEDFPFASLAKSEHCLLIRANELTEANLPDRIHFFCYTCNRKF